MNDTGETITSKELARRIKELQIERHKNPEKWKGLSYGIPFIDEVTGGARREEVIVLAGSHKAGKTTLGQNLAKTFGYQLMETNEVGLVVSLEMSYTIMANRFIANAAELDVNKLRDYTLTTEDDWDAFYFGTERLEDLPVYWNVRCFTVEALENLLYQYAEFVDEETAEIKKLRFVVIDYFQLMSSTGNKSRRWEELMNISRKLKQVANTLQITIILLSQQTREALSSLKKQKSSNTIAGTQALIQDVDMLMMLLPVYKDKKEVNHLRELYIAESRNTDSKVGCEVVFSGKYSRIGPIADIELEELPVEMKEERAEVQKEWSQWWN